MKGIVGVVLAGGRSSRMGGEDKSFLRLGDKPLIQHVIDRAKPQVEKLIISTNSANRQYQQFNLPLIVDLTVEYAGPLAGLLSAMDYATKNHGDFSHLASFPVDSPFYPKNLVKRLADILQFQKDEIVIPRYQGRGHWVFGLWPLGLMTDLHHYLFELQARKAQDWIQRHSHRFVDFDDLEDDPFFNINAPEDLSVAMAKLSQ